MQSNDEKESKRQGAREMRTAGLVITFSLILSLIVAALIVIFGHIKLY